TQVVAKVPMHAEAISRLAHQLAFRANAFKEHDQLQLEEDDRIKGGTALACVGLVHELAYKRKVQSSFQMPIEVILRNQFLQRNIAEWSKVTLFAAHHGGTLPQFNCHTLFCTPTIFTLQQTECLADLRSRFDARGMLSPLLSLTEEMPHSRLGM